MHKLHFRELFRRGFAGLFLVMIAGMPTGSRAQEVDPHLFDFLTSYKSSRQFVYMKPFAADRKHDDFLHWYDLYVKQWHDYRMFDPCQSKKWHPDISWDQAGIYLPPTGRNPSPEADPRFTYKPYYSPDLVPGLTYPPTARPDVPKAYSGPTPGMTEQIGNAAAYIDWNQRSISNPKVKPNSVGFFNSSPQTLTFYLVAGTVHQEIKLEPREILTISISPGVEVKGSIGTGPSEHTTNLSGGAVYALEARLGTWMFFKL